MGKMLNKIANGFSPRRWLVLLFSFSLPNTYIAWTDTTDAIFFAFANQKAHYDKKYQLFFIKISNWATLKFNKGYLILFSAEITKKLTY